MLPLEMDWLIINRCLFFLIYSSVGILCTAVSVLEAILIIHATVICVDTCYLIDTTNRLDIMSCNICQKRVLAHSYHLTCVSCEGVVHLNCLPKMTRDAAIYTETSKSILLHSVSECHFTI